MSSYAESTVEAAALDWFAGLGYAVLHGLDLTPGEPGGERASYRDVVLGDRLRRTIAALNPTIPPDARDEAVRKLLRRESPALVEDNRAFHRWLVDGVPVEYKATAPPPRSGCCRRYY